MKGLRAHVAAPVALPGEAGYERATPWNAAAAVEPAAVVLAATAYDIANTVGFAAARGYRVAVQSTGHGAMVVALTEIMPVEVRTTGFSLAYSLATATFGGFTPAACTYLIHVLDTKAAPGLWLTGAAVLGLIATVVLFRGNKHELRTAQAAIPANS